MNELFDTPPSKVLFLYSVWQNIYTSLRSHLGDRIIFQTDIPSQEVISEIVTAADEGEQVVIREDVPGHKDLINFFMTKSHTLLICDDKSSELDSNPSWWRCSNSILIT